MSWSAEQHQAIYSRNQNLLVAAAAGSGKTSVLVERIIQRLLDKQNPVDITQLLVVTFTKAAAAEMRTRVGNALTAALAAGDNRQHIERQLLLLNAASISTLHSFCQSIVRQYFYRLDLDPAFRLAGEAEIELLQFDVMDKLFGERYETGDEAFYRLIEHYGGERDDVALAGLILKLYNFARSHPWPEHWLRQLPEAFIAVEPASIDATVWSQLIREKIGFELEQALAHYEVMLSELAKPGQPEAYQPVLESDVRQLTAVLAAAKSGWQHLAEALSHCKFEELPRKKQPGVSDEAKEFQQNGRKRAKALIKKTSELHFSATQAELLADMAAAGPVVQDLIDLTLAYQEAFQQAKASKGLLDFHDLEHFCLKVLLDPAATPEQVLPSPVAQDMQSKYVEVMVDEYQDTNGVQETILQLVARSDNRFMVGDVKQSIYRFRLAEPGLFMNKYNCYPLEDTGRQRRIDLSQNFRSQAGVLHAVNFLFKQVMTKNAAEMDYGEKEYLNAGLVYPATKDRVLSDTVEVHLIDRDGGGETTEEQGEEAESAAEATSDKPVENKKELSRFEQEAWLIARRMLELKQQGYLVYDKGAGWRPLLWRDMVVLLRAVSGKAAILLEALRYFGIPAYAEQDSGYFQATEVQIMLSLLNVIDNPRQDIHLAAVLRSPLVGLSAAALAEIRLADGGDLWNAVTSYCQAEQSDEKRARVTGFLHQLRQWRSFARRRGVAELIWRLYRDTGFYDYAGGMAGGTIRQANLQALYDRARQFEATNFRGLFRFLRFLDRLLDDGSDMAVARALGEGEDVVRIMSIHKSKGLEFPVVFVADLGKEFNLRDTREAILLHKSLGIGPYRYHPEQRFQHPTLAWHGISHRLVMETKAEEQRILYVALTRAREKLILVGAAAEMAEKCAQWCRYTGRLAAALPDAQIATAKTYLDWLMPAIARHPDGEPVRRYGGHEGEPAGELAADFSRWDIRIYRPADLDGLQGETNERHPWLDLVERLEPVPADDSSEWVFPALNWQYGHENALGIPAKLSVTEIKRRFETTGEDASQAWQQPPVIARPRFIQNKSTKFNGAEIGTIMHTVMQQVDWQRDITPAGIASQVQELVNKEILLIEEVSAVDTQAVSAFFSSGLGQRLIRSVWSKREMAFSLLVPAERFYGEMQGEDEKIFIQGIVDCIFDDGDGLVLIDYKTDRVKAGQELAGKYATQLRLYAQAVATILERPVKETYLYVFSTSEVIAVDVHEQTSNRKQSAGI